MEKLDKKKRGRPRGRTLACQLAFRIDLDNYDYIDKLAEKDNKETNLKAREMLLDYIETLRKKR